MSDRINVMVWTEAEKGGVSLVSVLRLRVYVQGSQQFPEKASVLHTDD